MENNISISFILPTYNEEHFIEDTIRSIIHNIPKGCTYEIIICDNGSIDKTLSIARKYDCNTLIDKSASIGKLRNLGASIAKGDILVFLDADVRLTEYWQEKFPLSSELLKKHPKLITGSKCDTCIEPSWIELVWFKPIIENSPNNPSYINSGHLIVNSSFFHTLGGFNEHLRTGEDFDFCIRATRNGGTILNNKTLRVIHDGYPKNFPDFFLREVWHGMGDWENTQTFFSSKVALASLGVFLLSILSLLLISFGQTLSGLLIMSLIFAGCFIAFKLKSNATSLTTLLAGAALYYSYFIARFFSFIPKKNLHHKRGN